MFAVHVYERVRITDLGSIVNDLGLINDLSFVVSLKKKPCYIRDNFMQC